MNTGGEHRQARVRLLTLAAVIAVPAFAQTIYTWEDAEGIHCTDAPSRLPKNGKRRGW